VLSLAWVRDDYTEHSNLRAKLSPEVQKLGDANRLRNLKSALQLAYKTVRDRIQRSYSKNKRYYDRTAQQREIREGDIVYVYNPAKKPNVSRKFAPVWDGPSKVIQKKGKLNFRIEDANGKETVVHINRLKRAKDQSIWQPKRKKTRPDRKPRARQETDGEDAEVVISTGPITVPVPQVEPGPTDPNTPDRELRDVWDTPNGHGGDRESPEQQSADPNYIPSESPRSRFELRTTRDEPPISRSKARLHRYILLPTSKP
jgi:hypothetical protein